MRRSIRWGLYALVLGGLVAGTMAWLIVDKSVTLEVDGKARTVHTVSRHVSGVLDDANITIGEHDIVAPEPTAKVSDGDKVIVRYGRLLHLTVDGAPKDVWVTAPTVQEALDQLGYNPGSYSSVSRSTRLPVDPSNIDLRTPKNVTVQADGQTVPLTTTDATVSDALAAAGIVLGPDDIISVPVASPVTEGLAVVINRVAFSQVDGQVAIPFDTQQTQDATLAQGKTVVDTTGVNGTANVTYRVKTVDGAEASRDVIAQTVVTPPVTQVQRVGTKPAVTSTPSTSTGSTSSDSAPPASTPVASGSPQDIAHAMVLDRGWGEDQFSCLVSLWNRESGWRVNASNPSGAYGIPQAMPGSKMAAFGSDWQTNPATQIAWGLSYIAGSYGTPCGAWASSQSRGWY